MHILSVPSHRRVQELLFNGHRVSVQDENILELDIGVDDCATVHKYLMPQKIEMFKVLEEEKPLTISKMCI